MSNSEKLNRTRGGFARSVLALSGGALVAQALGILSSPVITRLFSPEAIGIAAVFTSIIGIVGLVGCLQYQLAIPLSGSDEDGANLLSVSYVALSVVVALTAVFAVVVAPTLFRLIQTPELTSIAAFLPLGVFFLGSTHALTYWFVRYKRFERLAFSRVMTSVIGTTAALTIGFLGLTTGPQLVVARLIGIAAGPAFLYMYVFRADLGFLLRSVNTRRMLLLAKRYRKFPLVSSWNALLSQVSREIPTVMMASFFGVRSAGFYALSSRLLTIPSTLISNAVGQVFFQRASESQAKGESLSGMVERVVDRLVAGGLLPLLVFAMTGPTLFQVVLGDDWTEAGLYATVLSLWLFFMFVTGPLMPLYNVLERQEMLLFLNLGLVTVRILALIVGGSIFGDAVYALLMFSIGSLLFNVISIIYLAIAVHARLAKIMMSFLRYALFATPTACIIGYSRWYVEHEPLQFLLVSALATLPYAAFVLLNDRERVALLWQARRRGR